jgi:fumarate hydratase class II
VIGYDKASQIAHRALDENTTLKDAAIKSGVNETLYNNIVIPSQLTHPGAAKANTARHTRP